MNRLMALVTSGVWLLAGGLLWAAPATKPITCEIDGSRRYAISRYIYGANRSAWQRKEHYFTLGRWGGPRATTYNWENNASNGGTAEGHQNDSALDASDTPGNAVRQFIAAANAAQAAVIVTIPMLGYVAADKQGDGDVGRGPNYLQSRFLPSLPRKQARFSFYPDLNDGKVYQDEFVNYVEKMFSPERRHPLCRIFYALDHEPELWPAAHPRLRTQKLRYAELVRLSIEYARAIKAVAPQALVFGPVCHDWAGCATLQDAPDGQGRDFLDYYLQQMRAAEQSGGVRLLDVLDVHWYPEARGGGVRITEDDSRPAVAHARVQAPRSLWDPHYREESWVAAQGVVGPIRLLPRLQEKIARHYPGTKLAISEYYYGGGDDISGALAQADVLGIFGREGVFAAAVQEKGPGEQRFLRAAFAMFRNYDDDGGSFGEAGLPAQTTDHERTSIYASLDGKGRVVAVLLNKSPLELPVRLVLKRCPPALRAKVYQLTKLDARVIALPDLPVSPFGILDCRLPPESITTFQFVGGAPPAKPSRGAVR
jgi:hypothetical protein